MRSKGLVHAKIVCMTLIERGKGYFEICGAKANSEWMN